MNELPKENRCHKCGEWFHTVHACPSPLALASAPPAPAASEPVATRALVEECRDALDWLAALTSESPAPAADEPVAYVNADELDNMLDDRTVTIQGQVSGWRKTPLYRAPQPPAASSNAPPPCEESARVDLLHELEDMRIELYDRGQETTARLFEKAMDWINGKRDDAALRGEHP